jgi:hypothetical protein
MENNQQLLPQQAFEVIYRLTGNLTLNRQDGQLLDLSLRTIAQLLPKEEGDKKND